MSLLNNLAVFLLLVSTSLAVEKNFRCDDDWFAYNEEKCYKVVNTSLTKDEAHTACGDVRRTSYVSSIVTIKSRSEQTFLYNYVSNKLGIDDNVWIGAIRVGDNQSSTFEWEDGSHIHYRNWAQNRPSNDPDSSCVQISSNNGKWVDVSCDRTGIVICEKLQIWTFPQLLDKFFELRRRFEYKNEELNEILHEKDQKIEALERSVNNMDRRLSSLRREFDRMAIDFDSRLNSTIDFCFEQNEANERKIKNLEKKTDKIVDGMLALHEECSNGCSAGGDGDVTDEKLDKIKKQILKEVDKKIEPIERRLDDVVTDARLAIISYRRTLQIKKKDEWISLGYV